MGCFSFKCQGCDTAINSTSFEGERCKLFLLKDGKVIQQMEGQYDSYGRVFIDDTQREDVKHELRKSQYWENPFPEREPSDFWEEMGPESWAWHNVCELLFSGASEDNGIAAYHIACYNGEVPAIRSEDDPNQGWDDLRDKFR